MESQTNSKEKENHPPQALIRETANLLVVLTQVYFLLSCFIHIDRVLVIESSKGSKIIQRASIIMKHVLEKLLHAAMGSSHLDANIIEEIGEKAFDNGFTRAEEIWSTIISRENTSRIFDDGRQVDDVDNANERSSQVNNQNCIFTDIDDDEFRERLVLLCVIHRAAKDRHEMENSSSSTLQLQLADDAIMNFWTLRSPEAIERDKIWMKEMGSAATQAAGIYTSWRDDLLVRALLRPLSPEELEEIDLDAESINLDTNGDSSKSITYGRGLMMKLTERTKMAEDIANMKEEMAEMEKEKAELAVQRAEHAQERAEQAEQRYAEALVRAEEAEAALQEFNIEDEEGTEIEYAVAELSFTDCNRERQVEELTERAERAEEALGRVVSALGSLGIHSCQ